MEVKVGPRRWVSRARVNWEKVNGKLPEGYVLKFKDGNPRNDRVENLMPITRAELVIFNHSYKSKKWPDLTEVILMKIGWSKQ